MNIQNLPRPEEIAASLGMDGHSRRRKWLKRTVWLVLALGLIAAGLWWYQSRQTASATVTYTTQAAARRDLVIKVQATGNIQPTTQVDVSSELSGVIRSVAVDYNSIVKKGDVLAELDTTRLKGQLARARAALAAATAQVATAKATLEQTDAALQRASTLRSRGVSSVQDMNTAQAEYDRAKAGVALAEANVAVAEADVSLQQSDIDKSRILSPVNGIVLKRAAEPGQTVAASFQAPVLFTLAEDLARMEVDANVDEADIGPVKEGQEASFTVDAYPGRSFPAKVQLIQFSPVTTDNVITYTAILAVDNSALLLRPGMTATAQIVVKQVTQALVVPNAALRFEPPKAEPSKGFSLTSLFMPRMPRFTTSGNKAQSADGTRTLYVLDNGQPKAVTVKTGANDGQATEIVSGGLKDGDAVITGSSTGSK